MSEKYKKKLSKCTCDSDFWLMSCEDIFVIDELSHLIVYVSKYETSEKKLYIDVFFSVCLTFLQLMVITRGQEC